MVCGVTELALYFFMEAEKKDFLTYKVHVYS